MIKSVLHAFERIVHVCKSTNSHLNSLNMLVVVGTVAKTDGKLIGLFLS